MEVNYEEVDDVIVTWGYSLAGHVAGGLPRIEAITRLRSSWKIANKFHIYKSTGLVFQFENEEDRQKILDGGPYMIHGRPLILKHMPLLFGFEACTNAIVLIWFTLLGLLVDLWNAQVLAKLCAKIGESLCTDAMTGRKDRISNARVLVEVDIAKDLVTEVPIKLPDGKLRDQCVIYENLPKFYNLC